MEMKIANRIKVKDIPEEMKQLIVQDLQMPNPKYVQAKTHGYSTWGIDKIIMNFNVLPDSSLMVPRGYRKKLLSIANDFGVEAEIDDQRTIFPTRLDIDSRYIQFRPHQWEPLHRIAQGETEGMIVAPAGSGKTILGVSIVAILGQPTLWLTHTRTLANQALERIDEFLPGLDKEEDIGIIGDGEWKIGNLFTVGMLQTLIRRKDLHKITNRFGMIILDEAHHCPASTFRKTITQFNPYYIFGLTATPYRRDKLEKVMFQVIGDTISSIPIGKVEEHGGIIRPKVLYRTIKSKIVGGLGSSPIQTILKHNIVNNNKRNAIIVGDVTREAMLGNYCMVVSDRKVHCENLSALISIGWKKTGIATGDYSKEYVEEQVQRFINNEITVLVATFALLGEGFDINFLNRVFIAMPFRAEAKVEQLVGRVQRTADGKNNAIVYDYVDRDIGILKNQFYTGSLKECRYNAYARLGLEVEPV